MTFTRILIKMVSSCSGLLYKEFPTSLEVGEIVRESEL